MSIFVNRVLNLKKIKAIGFDMDHTLVRYHTEAFEDLTFRTVISKLIKDRNYPESIKSLKFDPNKAIRGLVIDKKRGNMLKISLYGRIKQAYHGVDQMNFTEQQKVYATSVVDLNSEDYFPIDTAFSLSHAVLFMELISQKDKHPDKYPTYEDIADDVVETIDLAHRDGTLKTEVAKNLSKYIIQDEKIVDTCEKLKLSGKRLFIVTNSDYPYCKLLMEHAYTPFLKHHQSWKDLFEVTVTLARKPKFFNDKNKFLKIMNEEGLMANLETPLESGIYQGGHFKELEVYLGHRSDEIMYLGDHIYGDILTLKKNCQWRTALILEEIDQEVKALKAGNEIIKNVERLMNEKEDLEDQLDANFDVDGDKEQRDDLFSKIDTIDEELSKLIGNHQKKFNPYWGEIMRAGNEESRFAGQVAKYACLYMGKVSDLYDYSPRKYFRPNRRPLPHDE